MAIDTQRTACCIIRHCDDWVELESPTGEKRRIEEGKMPNGWDFLTPDELKFVNNLCAVESGTSCDLSWDVMRQFARLYNRVSEASPHSTEAASVSCKVGSQDAASTTSTKSGGDEKAAESAHPGNGQTVASPSSSDKKAASLTLPPDPWQQRLQEARDRVVKDVISRQAERLYQIIGIKTHNGTGRTEMERRITRLKKIKEKLKKLMKIDYGIFDHCKALMKKIDRHDLVHIPYVSCLIEPCGLLRSVGMLHGQGSHWHATEDQVKNPAVQELFTIWLGHGVYLDIGHVPEEDLLDVLRKADANLSDDLIEAHTSLITTIITADQQLEDTLKALEGEAAPSNKEQEKLFSKRDSRIRAAIKLARERVVAAALCAESYDSKEELNDLFEGINQAIQARDLAFQAEVTLRKRK